MVLEPRQEAPNWAPQSLLPSPTHSNSVAGLFQLWVWFCFQGIKVMKPGQQKSSGMQTQSFQGISRYNRALSIKQHGREYVFLTLKPFCPPPKKNKNKQKKPSTTANSILKHPQRITHIGTFNEVCSIYHRTSLPREKHRNQRKC